MKSPDGKTNLASTPTKNEKENLPQKTPLVLKVKKQSDGSLTCRMCFETFKTLQDVSKHAPHCRKHITLNSLDRENTQTIGMKQTQY